jgi:hypothetical protein
MNEITINQLGSLGEFIGAIAVVASLIYVAIHIKQNTNATRISTMQAHVDIWNDIASNFCQSSELASIWYQGLKGISTLKEGTKVQFFAQLGLIFRYYESSYLEWREDALDDRLWEGLHQTLVDQMSHPGACQWWEYRRHWFYTDFRVMVDEVVASGGGRAMYGEE